MWRVRLDRRIIAGFVVLGLTLSLAACGKDPGGPSGTSSSPTVGTELGDAPPAGGTANLAPQGVSVIVDRKRLVLPDGTGFPLDAVPGGALSGYQTRDGWLVRGYGNGVDTLSLWLVSSAGTLTQLIDRSDAPVAIGPDGRRLAWRTGGKLYAGHIDGARAIVDKTSPAPERGAPVALGTDSVVLGYSETGGGIDHHDTWVPSLGDYKPTWEKSAHVLAVYAPGRADGTYLGLVQGPAAGKDICLAVMDPRDSLKPTRTACGIVGLLDRHGAVSADGHWLGVLSAGAAGKGQIALMDLSTVFGTPTVTGNWPADMVGAWEDANNMLVASTALGGALVRYHLGSATPDPADRAGVAGTADIELLPRVG